MKRLSPIIVSALVGLALAAGGPTEAREGDDPPGQQRSASVDIWIENTGAVYAYLFLDFAAPGEPPAAEALNKALGCILQDVDVSRKEDEWSVAGNCRNGFPRENLVIEGQIDLVPLKAALAELEVDSFELVLGHVGAGFTRASSVLGEFKSKWGYGRYTYKGSPNDDIDALEISFGYRPGEPMRYAWMFLLVVCIPPMLVLGLNRRAIHRSEDARAGAWFSYAWAINGVVLLPWVVWWGIVWHYDLDYLPAFLLRGRLYGDLVFDLLRNSIWLAAPVVATILCTAASHPAIQQVGGKRWSRWELTRQTAWVLMALVLPAICVFTSINALVAHHYRDSALLIFAGFLFLLLLGMRARKHQEMTPQALTTGELRDRIFELAGQAGIRLQQLYVLPSGKGRMANAFAVGSRRVMISELVLEKLNKREVDSVLGHELAHLKGRHAWLLILAPTLLLALAAAPVVLFMHWVPGWAYGGLLAISVVVALGLVSRRLERTADAGGVGITDDPEAFISGMAKVTALNQLPMDWSKGTEFLLTHPSCRRRIEAAAKRAGIARERVEQILSAPASEPEEHYALPEPLTSQEKVLSTSATAVAMLRKSATDFAAITLPPALAVHMSKVWALDGPALFAFLGLALGLTLGIVVFFDKWEPLMGLGSLAKKLGEKLNTEGISAAELDGLAVGLGPHETPHVYENVHYWDAGHLFLTRDHLIYVGEETRFSLRRDQVTGIEWVAHMPHLWPDKIARVRWRNAAEDRGGVFYVGRLTPTPLRRLFDKESELERRVRAWKEGTVTVEVPAELAGLASPRIPEVTSQSLREALSWSVVVGSILATACVAMMVGFLFDFPFARTLGSQGDGWKIVLLATAVRSLLATFDRIRVQSAP